MNKNISSNDYKLLVEKYGSLDAIKDKLLDDYPIQYLIGNVDFYGYQIDVNPSVLIPRFETETLVEKTLSYIDKYHLDGVKVLEVGTGSGCISIALKKERDSLDITAIDISDDALKLAKLNAKKNNANINFLKSDVFDFRTNDKYSIIISNPPYISIGDNVSAETKYEPFDAIYVSGDPLTFYKRILEIASVNLTDRFLIAFEIDEEQGENLVNLSKRLFPKSLISL